FDLEVFAGHATGFERDESSVTSNTMVLMHDRRALGQFAEVADDRFGLAAGTLAAARLRGAFGEQLALGEERERGLAECEAVFQRCDRDREAFVVRREGGPVRHDR